MFKNTWILLKNVTHRFTRPCSWTVLLGLIILSYLSLTENFRTHLQRNVSSESNSNSTVLNRSNPPLDLLYLVAIIGSLEETDPYLQLLIPFTLHALLSGPLVGVEIILSEELFISFSSSRTDVIRQLHKQFGQKRLLIRTASLDAVNLAYERCKGHAPNFVRFLERPVLKAKVTFIADSDVLILYPSDQVVSSSLRHMNALNLPYSNILRPTDKQGRPGVTNRHLTGLHIVLSSDYYDTSKWALIMEWFKNERDEANHPSDEALLQRMMKVAFGLPSKQSSVRGTLLNQELSNELTWVDVYSWHLIWGIHLSPNRGAGKDQPLEASCKLCRMFDERVMDQVYEEFKRVDKDVLNAVRRVRKICACCTSEPQDSKVCKG